MSQQNFQNYYKNLLGEKEFDLFWSALNKSYSKAFRVNTLKWSVKDFQNFAKKETWKLKKVPFCKQGFWVTLPKSFEKPLGSTEPHLNGCGYIQGATSMYPVELLDVQEDDVVLDMCASPGGKTTHIAQKLGVKGFVIANEISLSRLAALRENIERLGVWNYAITNLKPSYFQRYYPKSFDKVLVDAPCSGEGMFLKSEEVMKKWSLKYIKGFVRMQVKILCSAFEALKEDGQLVYSTCTLNEFENEGVLKKLKGIYGASFEVLESKKFWPHKEEMEGFFTALILKKKSDASNDLAQNQNLRNQLARYKYSKEDDRFDMNLVGEKRKQKMNIPALSSGRPAQCSGRPAQGSGRPAQGSGRPALSSGRQNSKFLKRKMSDEKRAWEILPYKRQKEFAKRFIKYCDFALPDFFKQISENRKMPLFVQKNDEVFLQSGVFWEKFRYLSVRKVGLPFATVKKGGEIAFSEEILKAFQKD
ncbi:hypothetical protein A2335_03100 [Candidatus Peregrinibacteria bacterium RIFOXYB2_FULL_32_7]|nr:MAG: hypothetical protein A2335_03100 [Candidatus Peregrinibacteria bacterium RIFOXYB2_FULL_32_7]